MRTIHVVLTTHWDREWVQTLSQYRFRLVRLLDLVFDLLATDPAVIFVLDGQAVPLEDYLDVRPERAEILRKFLAEGRLVAGPWYVLADQFLEGDEATIRNLLLGMNTTRRHGGEPMLHGYVPDSFGSIATLPMILKGFGIKGANLGRGLTRPGNGGLFRWAWRDGSEVLGLAYGYGNAITLAWPDLGRHLDHQKPDISHVERWSADFLKHAAPTMQGTNLYASVGVDHVEPRRETAALVAHLDAKGPDRWRFSTPAAMIAAATAEMPAHAQDIPLVVGEQRGDAQRPMDLQGVLSTDPILKAGNRLAEVMLTRLLEPLAVLRKIAGKPEEQHHLRMAWKTLIRCHPHDSISACNRDTVVDDVRQRVRDVQDQAELACERWLRDCLPTTPWVSGPTRHFVLIDPMPGRGADAVECLVRMPAPITNAACAVIDEDSTVVGEARLLGHRQMDLETCAATNAGLIDVRSKDPQEDRAPADKFAILRVRLALDGTSAAVRKFQLAWWSHPPVTPITASARRIANDMVAVTVADDGSLTIEDLKNGRTFPGLAYLEDMADGGDTYDYGSIVGDVPLRTLGTNDCAVRLLNRDQRSATLRITRTWMLPVALAEGARRDARKRWPYQVGDQPGRRSDTLVALDCEMDVTVTAGSNRVAGALTVVNRSDHHRLRLGFSGRGEAKLTAGAHFAHLERTYAATLAGHPPFPVLDWIHRGDGLGILSAGMYEGDARKLDDSDEILLTVLRSTDTIGPAAGMNFDTERSRCLGETRARFALVPAASALETQRAALAWLTPVIAEGVNGVDDVKLPREILGCDDDQVVVTALKRAEAGGATVVRLSNPGPAPRTVRLRTGFAWSRAGACGLDERVRGPLVPAAGPGGPVAVEVPAFGLATVLFSD
jgi:alpha-mannosidase